MKKNKFSLTSKKALFGATLLISMIFTGCAPWQDVAGIQNIKEQNAQINLSNKWHKNNLTKKNVYMITKDGLGLQAILIKNQSLDEPLEFSKKKINSNIPPHELADLFIENIKLSNTASGFKLISNTPEIISGVDGANIVFTVKGATDMTVKVNKTIFIHDNKVYEFTYRAAKQHYYTKDINDFEDIKNSFKLDM